MMFRSSPSYDWRRLSRSGLARSLRLEGLERRELMAASIMDHSISLAAEGEGGSGGAGSGPIAYIINGNPTSAFPSVGIVGDTSGGFCSGTLIAPQYVLTAGHCATGVANTAGRFQLGSQTYSTSQVIVHPGYNENRIGEDEANDIAIYKLATPVTNVVPSPIYRSVPQVGQLLTLVGFGGGGTGNTGSDGSFGTKRVGTTPIDQVSPKLIHWNFDNNNESNTAPGDSGGPAFLLVGGVYQVAGVTSGGDSASAAIGDHSFDTRVDAFASWIDSIVGTAASTVTVGVQATDAAAAETLSSQASNTGSFLLTRTGATTAPLTVSLSWSGTAANGVDYATLSNSVTIPAGASSVSIVLTPRDDTLVEGAETAIMTLVPNAAYAINSSQSSSVVTIADNEAVASNDMFANRFSLSGVSASTTGSNRTATREQGEPNVLGLSGGKSVWWTWTAPVTGQVVIHTTGSNFDTTLGVYRGTTVNALSQVAANDDDPTSRTALTSRVVFQATAGQVFQIVVDGYSGANGSIRLALQQTAGRARSSMFDPSGSSAVYDPWEVQRNQGRLPTMLSDVPNGRFVRRLDRLMANSIDELLTEW